MEKYKKTDEKIKLGYELIMKNASAKACDAWLEAWEDLKVILAEEESKDIEILDNKYSWYELISNFIQDVEMELNNAGLDKEEYFKKRIIYCEELLEVLVDNDPLIIENTKRAIADSYYALGDKAKCDSLYSSWLSEDPAWGWGYIGWSDCYNFGTNKIDSNIVRAEEIIQIALEMDSVRDREDVFVRAIEIYNELGQVERVKELEEEVKYLTRQANTIVESVKVGRNDPCPCGSGKKYKKCCG